MSRHIISYEGVDEEFNRTHLKVGSLTWPDSPVPVIWNFGLMNPDDLLGHATDFRREETGEITAEISFNNTDKSARIADLKEELYATIYARDVAQKMKRGIKVISYCKIAAISICLGSEHTWSLNTMVGERSAPSTQP